ncbi:LOW QUALITY PROTEIN: uncharacterized protein Dmoj_GI25569 [Drosophila mojavensis]|uniref:Zinc finger CCHC domain-containing protein 7 n=1 Tax=Drosophila mojavensis TaxID=7230 RepID=A0A0Q9XBF1_DROMO|nr:LOW QUALITY PROTEIN: uncharacterized protein Dmoj_GI25569 [Drosophila mojavensis]
MSDLEEMDIEQLNELESILYASIHYNDATSGQQQHTLTADVDVDAQNMPPPQQQIEQQQQQQNQQHRFVSNKRIINNATAKPRYWADNNTETAAINDNWTSKSKGTAETPTTADEPGTTEQDKRDKDSTQKSSTAKKSASSTKQPKALTPVQKLLQQQQMRQPPKMQPKKQPQIQKPPKPQQNTNPKTEDDEPERFDQRLLVAIPSNWPIAKREQKGPFGKANRKLEQHQRLAEKRQKSKRVQANKKLRQNKGKSIELISLVDSEKSSDADDVVIVPLPPVPIINVDASDEEQDQQQPELSYLEENAMDAADVSLTGDRQTTEQVTMASQLNSPSSSVLSSDDFIVQKDTSRLLAERARATDEDLLVLTENAMREAAEPASEEKEQAADTSSEYEFVPPSRLEEIKQNYRVDEQQFRALDVYESESDLTESGVYCKAKQKPVPTIIRNVDSDSDSTDIEQVIEPTVNKTKRLRKRRASSTNQSQSDPNNECDQNDTESDDDAGVQSTGVPGIARGMAVERCKRKIRRISQRRNSESVIPSEQHKKKTPIDDPSSESPAEESLPTARQIAERLLKQKKDRERSTPEQRNDDTMDSIGSDANTEDEAEMNDAIVAVCMEFDKQKQEVSTTKSDQELEPNPEADAEAENIEANEAEINNIEIQSEPQLEAEVAEVQVVHNLPALEEQVNVKDLIGWNDEMCRFYNDSWHGENFNLQKILRGMSGQRSEWRINHADRFPPARKRSNLKCSNCYEMGHMRSKCPRPRKPIICYMCGMTGHAEPRCPNAMCLGCGSKQSIYVQTCNKCSFHTRMICQLCKMRGHSSDKCPDLWRRYHSTTRTNAVLNSNVQYRTKHCSYCAQRGHLFEECRQRMGEFRNVNHTIRIISHQKVYQDRSEPISYLTDLRSSFSMDLHFHFNWSSAFSKNSCYARFLKAVGLAKPAEKRKKNAPVQQQQLKLYTNDYVPNPHARASRRNSSATNSSAVAEQLPAGPDTALVAAKDSKVAATKPASEQIQQEEISSNFESKSAASKKSSSNGSLTASKSTVTPHDLDSDSNYSFSEHFEVPSSTTRTNEQDTEAPPANTGPMENLPDIIPLSTNTEEDEANDVTISTNGQGISMCVNNKAAPATAAAQPESLPDVPSEAKILMARDQIEYLFSPEGREFLTASAKLCNVSVRMDFKEYGYVLVIYGLKKNQEDLQLRLLRRNQDVKRKTTEFQSQKPPKRIDVLIRFMRDGISSLAGDLGNAKAHYFRIKELEQMNTKSGYKLAERKRRLLNMILFGQAGLSNGNMHLDQLLIILKRLLNEHAGDENATTAMRNEIEEHWRIIFSAYPHPNYESLLQAYFKLDVKNRISSLNIEPALLGQQIVNKKRERIASPPPAGAPDSSNKTSSPNKRVLLNAKWADQQQRRPPPPPLWKHDERAQSSPVAQPNSNSRNAKPRTQPHAKSAGQQKKQLPPPPPIWQHEVQQQQQQQHQQQHQQHQQQQQHNTNNKQRIPKQQRDKPRPVQQQQQQHTAKHLLPFNNMQQRTPVGKLHLQQNRPLQSECVRCWGMERGDSRINTDASKPSMFWSRESLKYLDDLFKLTSNSETLERLQRVLDRSRRGELSHNDYRAVIRLHSLMEPH